MELTQEMLNHYVAVSDHEELQHFASQLIPMLTPKQFKMLGEQFKYRMVFVGTEQEEEQEEPEEEDETPPEKEQDEDEPADDDELALPQELR